MKRGCIHGRFQPFHNGHYEYFCEAARRCNSIIVGITQYNRNIVDSASPAHRLDDAENPFSYWERSEIIRAAVRAAQLDLDLTIVPFPIETPENIANFVDKEATMFTTIYDKWNLTKIRRLLNEGYQVEILWRRRIKAYEGRRVRELLNRNPELIRNQVPPGAFDEIVKFHHMKP